MKSLIPLSIAIMYSLITLTSCISSTQQSQPTHSHPLQQASGCTTDQINIALASIDACQTNDIVTSLKCISSKITKNNTQEWNIFLKNNAQNSDVVMYWLYDNCSININNYGKFNRTYLLWPTQSYLNSGRENINIRKNLKLFSGDSIKTIQQKLHNHIQKNSFQPNIHQKEPNFVCPQWKVTQVKKIISACDIAGNNRAAQCIITRIRDQLSQNWNTKVSTTLQSDVNYYSYNGCSIQLTFGTFTRYIYVWKATQ